MSDATLEHIIRQLIKIPRKEPEALTSINILQGIQWFRVMFRDSPTLFEKRYEANAAMIIADHLAKEGYYEYSFMSGIRYNS